MTITNMIKNVLKKMQDEGVSITPNEYKKYFCIEARRNKIAIEDCRMLDKFVAKMDEDLQKQFRKYSAKDIDDLFVFLVSNLNRAKLGDAEFLNSSLYLFLHTLMDTLQLFASKDARNLALDTKNKLNIYFDQASIDFLRNRWIEFNKSYDSSFGDEWEDIIPHPKTIEELSSASFKEYTKQKQRADFFEEFIEFAAKPSVSDDSSSTSSIKEALRKYQESKDIKSIENDIMRSFDLRVSLDRAKIDEKTKTISEIVNVISSKLISFIDRNKQHTKIIIDIKENIVDINNMSSVDDIKNRLLSITDKLESEINALNTNLNDKNSEILELNKKINTLEESLKVSEKKSKIDYLTKTLTKRAFDDELDRFEAIFQRHGSEYAIVFLDIDHFKHINDTYGHDAGDKILSTIGKILNNNTRGEDVVGRFGGEEFVALLPSSTKDGATTYAEHIRKSVESSRFIYKNQKIEVTISSGVALRSQNESMKDTVNKADLLLYEAKKSGRNRVKA